ncbi:MAG: HupE/UreJ family protein [Proteobacteria bacterium]|nr:HupE/UreJ family protein [Pseudomonadota bacterium]MDA0953012.1 HupE/UreJ family protein [Pseudomonadota bacterium]
MRIVLVAATLVATAMPAFAHTGVGPHGGLAAGFTHPLLGLDHLLAMIAVGLFAAARGGKALWLVPLAFVAMMAGGGALAMAGIQVPMVELGIALSVVVLGAAVALRLSLPVAGAMALVGAFALFHGHAHGAEIPAGASALTYAAGFVAATAMLHGIGIAIGMAAGYGSRRTGQWAVRSAGSVMALAGVGMLAGVI